MERKSPRELTSDLTDFVNSFDRDKNKAFIEAFCREHNTLQQSCFRMFLELIEHMASEDYHTDGRNDASKQVAITLMKGFKMAKKQEYMLQGETEEKAEEYASSKHALKPSNYLPYI